MVAAGNHEIGGVGVLKPTRSAGVYQSDPGTETTFDFEAGYAKADHGHDGWKGEDANQVDAPLSGRATFGFFRL